MAKSEVASIYTAGLLQGVAMVAFPATATIFTSASGYGMTSTEYGSIFLPDIIIAILSAVMGGRLAHSCSLKSIYLWGLLANMLSMGIFLLSALMLPHQEWAFGLLFVATGLLGLGFGLTVPVLNTFMAIYSPKKVDSALLILNALLGLGTALAPVFIAVFDGLGFWWGLPLILMSALGLLLALSSLLPFESGKPPEEQTEKLNVIPSAFWLFAAGVFLYGILETMSGNWATVYLTKSMQADVTEASLALTSFWGAVTLGRVIFAFSNRFVAEGTIYKALPLVIAFAYLCVYWQEVPSPWSGIWIFGLAGFGCSALLPLSISFASNALPTIRKSVAGGLIAAYLTGYGVSAFGVGPLEKLGIDIQMIFGLCALIAIAFGILAYFITYQRKQV
ncbi:MAG: MFS transporter [Parachlamydiales bacterium]|jgi:MFS family permease